MAAQLGLVAQEAGVYATIVWFPYLGLRAAQKCGASTPSSVAWAALRGAGVALASLAAGFSILTLLFSGRIRRLALSLGISDLCPQPSEDLPPNPLGPIWLVAAALGIGAIALVRRKTPRRLRTGTVCLLGTPGRHFVLYGPEPRQQCAEPVSLRRPATGHVAVDLAPRDT